ncbi:hypothetical protein N7517_003685 [Penicillium concentricum]|uniref:Uncharacterized protein n=1 Tax=Penicillium concentricum TaxID=293559 RepID=A0A9W9V8P4_9EURO|nr:uncharacterized protein N7517_003685 [Penicillium concentricum]KAJ5371679.1 hypothetical protein N7517_003685 [Penicillium concentricum]
MTAKTTVAHQTHRYRGRPLELVEDTDSLLDAITDVYQQYINIMDARLSGYGSWSIANPMGSNQTAGYTHVATSQEDFDPLFQRLQKYNGSSLHISVNWYNFPTYGAYFQALSGVSQAVRIGSPNSAMTSRVFGKDALTSLAAL